MPSAGQRNYTGRIPDAWNAAREAFDHAMNNPLGSRFNTVRHFFRDSMMHNPGYSSGLRSVSAARFGMIGLSGIGALRSLGAARNRFRRGEYTRSVGNLAAAGGLGYLGYQFARGNAEPAVALTRRGFAFGAAAKAFLKGIM